MLSFSTKAGFLLCTSLCMMNHETSIVSFSVDGLTITKKSSMDFMGSLFDSNSIVMAPEVVNTQPTPVLSPVQKAPTGLTLNADNPEVKEIINLFVADVTTYVEANKAAILKKEALPKSFSHADVYDWVTSAQRAKDGCKPRLEIRKLKAREGEFVGEVANIAMAFANGDHRSANVEKYLEKGKALGLSMVQGGSTTLEIGNEYVDKATVLDYLAYGVSDIKDVLPNYRKGELIDASVEFETILATDADGTMWVAPKTGEDPYTQNFSNSRARSSIKEYLRAGGVLCVISGNDPIRTAEKFVINNAFAEHEKHLLYNVILAAAGGHALMVADLENPFEFYESTHYRPNAYEALESAKQARVGPNFRSPRMAEKKNFDVFYLGDDAKFTGNDFAAFNNLGFENSALVGSNKENMKPKVVTQIEKSGKASNIYGELMVDGEHDGPETFAELLTTFMQMRRRVLKRVSFGDSLLLPFFDNASMVKNIVRQKRTLMALLAETQEAELSQITSIKMAALSETKALTEKKQANKVKTA